MRNQRGQSAAEYAIVLAVVLAALVAMQVYVKRGAQGRLKVGVDQYTKAGSTAAGVSWLDESAAPTGADDVKLTPTVGVTDKGQYEPYYAESQNDIARRGTTVDDTDLAGNKVTRTIAAGATEEGTTRKVGSYQKQRAPGEAD